MEKFIKINLFFYIFLKILFLNKFIFSNCQILTNIIRLGDHPYRYNHFSYNSNGDLIIDTESYPLRDKRKFFGITKDGKEYFTDISGNKNYHLSIDGVIGGRVEGESCFIKIKSSSQKLNGKEYLLGISKILDWIYNTEFYNFYLKSGYSFSTHNLFGDIVSNVFSIIPDPLNSKTEFNNYFISYIVKIYLNTYKLYTIKAYFYMDSYLNIGMTKTYEKEMNSENQAIVSCFFTSNYLYICFYINNVQNLTIRVLDPRNNNDKETYIYYYTEKYFRRFYKGILLKDVIGFFAYFKDDGNKPYFSLYQIQSDKTAQIYKSYNEITISGSYINHEMLNDLVKLNDNMTCFVGASEDRKKLNIITFSFYSPYEYMKLFN